MHHLIHAVCLYCINILQLDCTIIDLSHSLHGPLRNIRISLYSDILISKLLNVFNRDNLYDELSSVANYKITIMITKHMLLSPCEISCQEGI